MDAPAGCRDVDGLVELTEDLSASPLYNKDLAPTTVARRTWNRWHIAALWIGMAICIPTYMLGADLLKNGLSWWQAVAAVLLGNLIVLVPMALNAHAGTKYGIPFPVFLRAPFGTTGSNVPALLRAAVACGWFGIQTWIGGKALFFLAGALWPSILEAPKINDFLGISAWQLGFFLLFWVVNVYFVLAGTESIKWLETYSAPILIAVGLGLLAWGAMKGGGLGHLLAASENFTHPTVSAHRHGDDVIVDVSPVAIDGAPKATQWRAAADEAALADAAWQHGRITTPASRIVVEFRDGDGRTARVPADVSGAPAGAATDVWVTFFTMVTAMVAFWATLSLNIPDFTRFARSQRDQVVGQFLGLPTTMGLYAFIGIAVTCATLVVFPDILVTEQAPWDPMNLFRRFEDKFLVIGSMFFLMIATLTTNIAANVVSPANDFSNLAPRLISFKTGGLITAVIGVLMMPWKLAEDPRGYIFTWLLGYSALLGPIAGILIADYYVVRRTRLELPELYRPNGMFRGVNVATLLILALAIAPNVPGFLDQVGVAGVADFWKNSFRYAWFVGFAVAFVLYSLWKPTRTSSPAAG